MKTDSISGLCTSLDRMQGCGEVTDNTLSGRRITCNECGFEREIPNDMINSKIRDLARIQENFRERLIRAYEEERYWREMLVYVPPVKPVSLWKKFETPMPCVKCGRSTKMTYNGVAHCPDGECRHPRTARVQPDKLTFADMEDLLLQMFSDDEEAVEVIKAKK